MNRVHESVKIFALARRLNYSTATWSIVCGAYYGRALWTAKTPNPNPNPNLMQSQSQSQSRLNQNLTMNPFPKMMTSWYSFLGNASVNGE